MTRYRLNQELERRLDALVNANPAFDRRLAFLEAVRQGLAVLESRHMVDDRKIVLIDCKRGVYGN